MPSSRDFQSFPVVCITGASAGVGRAIALAFAAYRHASIGLIARSADALEEVKREVDRLGGRALVLPLDVADAWALKVPLTGWRKCSAPSTSGSIRLRSPFSARCGR